ncbi:uncharacterized protein LOC128551098 isoform X2 [Mercenaria mercenaria]|uniref:uncharacterized protein LOC128551098 isoform X2 n=1 Tax=Mercenaria mercenaria TaxID=6596 RepID=UPI00234EB6B0|nr:uncharacterized protein LOC128551098 isoform X2 [Mercenaria mercenaria]
MRKDKNMKRKRQMAEQTKNSYAVLPRNCVPPTASLSSTISTDAGPRANGKLVPKHKVKRIKADESNVGVNKKPRTSPSTKTGTKSSNVKTEEIREGKSQKKHMKRKRKTGKPAKAWYVVLPSMNAEVDPRTSDKLVPKIKVKRIKLDESKDGVNKEPKALPPTSTGTKSCDANSENKTEEKYQRSDICQTCCNRESQPLYESSTETRREAIERCICKLVHSASCNDLNCLFSDCHKMKLVIAHTRSCRKKHTQSCPICKQLIALCCYHAKHCAELICSVPFCLQIKHKLQVRREQEARLVRQRKLQLRRKCGSIF